MEDRQALLGTNSSLHIRNVPSYSSNRFLKPSSPESSIDTSSQISQIDIRELDETSEPDGGCRSTSAVLSMCKTLMIRPYLRLLAVIGLRSYEIDSSQRCSLLAFLGYLHLFFILGLTILGYILQSLSCFRRDRGFVYGMTPDHQRICYGSITLSYFFPSALHFLAFIYALRLLRSRDNEQLPLLVERVFLLTSGRDADASVTQRRLVRCLWFVIAVGIIWVFFSMITVNILMAQGEIIFKFVGNRTKSINIVLKICLVISTLVQDLIQATIITTYCIQSQLLISYLKFMRSKLLYHSMPPLEWIREISEFRRLLRFLNDQLAPSIEIFTIVNISWAASGITWLFQYDKIDHDTIPVWGISVVNVILWAFIAAAPFVQAARLSNECSHIQCLGHEVRARPFTYQDTPGEDLDTILLYTSSLRLKAKIFRVPITGRYLCFTITMFTIILLTLGQCHVLMSS